MTLIADILLAAGAFGAAIYCSILSARLKKFSTLESGMGGAIAVLSAQVDDMTQALETARGAATGSAAQLEDRTRRAEAVSSRLELLVASLHDLPQDDDDDVAPSMSTDALADADRRMRFVRRRVARPVAEAAE
jgi:Domain of unknown function (DUF6468)